jgi:hypothetical protein
MEKKHCIKYGEKTIEMSLFEKNLLQELHSNEVSPISDLEKELNNLLETILLTLNLLMKYL